MTDRRNRLAFRAVALLATLLLAWGADGFVALALLGYMAMVGVIVWLAASQSRRTAERDYEHR